MLEYKLTCSAGLKMFLTFLLFVFSHCCCRGFVSSFLNRPHTSQSWRLSVQALNMLKCDWCGITSNNIGSKRTVTGKEKKKAVHHFWFVLYCFNLFQQVLFESLFFCWFFFFSSKDAKIVVHQPLTSYELPSRQQRVWLWYVFWSTVQSLSLFTQWHLALREKLQSMVTALEYL